MLAGVNAPRPQPNRRGFSAVPFLGDLVVLMRVLRDKDAHWGLKVTLLATLAYVISPIDALPEAVVPMIGWIDDVGLVLAIRTFLDAKLTKYRYPLFESPPPPVLSERTTAVGARARERAGNQSVG